MNKINRDTKNMIIDALQARIEEIGKKPFGNPTGEYEYRIAHEALNYIESLNIRV
jgi:hypothetical protein